MAPNRLVTTAVAGAIALQPFNPISVVGPVSIADVALVAALGLVVGQQLITDDGWLAAGVRPLAICLGALIAWVVIAAGGWHVTQFGAFALVVALVALYVRSSRDIETLLWGALLGSVIISLLTIYSSTLNPAFGGRVIQSRLPPPIDFARTVPLPGGFGAVSTYVLAPLPFAIIKWYRSRRRWLLAPILSTIAAVVLLQTRATYLAFAAAMGVLAAGVHGRRMWELGWRNAGGSALVLTVGGAASLAVGRVLYAINPENVTSRVAQFQRSLVLMAQHPLTGVPRPVLQHFPVTGHTPHNMFLHTGVAAGVPAAAVLLLMLGVALAGCWRGWLDHRSRWTALALAAGLAATVINLGLTPGQTRAYWLLIASSTMLIYSSDGDLSTMPWIRTAVRTSAVATALRRATRNSTVLGLLTADATDTRRRLAAGWQESRCRRAVSKLQAAITNSAVVAFLTRDISN